jgi:hypothetical protein
MWDFRFAIAIHQFQAGLQTQNCCSNIIAIKNQNSKIKNLTVHDSPLKRKLRGKTYVE